VEAVLPLLGQDPLTGEEAVLTRRTVASAHAVTAHASAHLQQAIITHAQRRDVTTRLLSVKTRRRAVTGNTRSREASETGGGPPSLGQRPSNPAHTLAWSR
jgi:hypothetical protein